MGLFLVTCTRTRAWTPASGPRTFLSARGTNQSSQISLLPFARSKACFPSSIPKETEDHRPHPFPGTEESHGQSRALPHPQPRSSSQPCWHPRRASSPSLHPQPQTMLTPTLSACHKFPAKSWLRAEFFRHAHVLCVVPSPVPAP